MERSVYIIHCPPSWLKTAPLSLIYLENYLKSNGVMVKVRDINAELFKSLQLQHKDWLVLNSNFEENLFTQTEHSSSLLKSFYQEIKDYEYIGFSLLKRNSSFSFALAEKIREMFPAKKIIFGGPQTLFLDHQNKLDPSTRTTGIAVSPCSGFRLKNKKTGTMDIPVELHKNSFWVIGEGEYATAKILNGATERIQRFQELENLDMLPFLDFSCLKVENYSNSLPLLSSRGCKFNCNFCSERKLYSKFRQHSPEYVSDLVKYLAEKHKTNTFIFCDSLINYSNKWLEEFCVSLIKNNLKVKWEAQMRVDKNFDVGLGKLMKASGCYNLFIGLESASINTLKNMNKGFNPDTALDFLKKLMQSGLHFEISLIFGYPGETEADFNSTLNFVIKNKSIIPKIAQANPFIDYMAKYTDEFPAQIAIKRIRKFVKSIETEKIRYTKSFINNLVYRNNGN